MRRTPLTPIPDQGNLFHCNMEFVSLKGDMGSMEHPVYSLTTSQDMRNLEYRHGSNWLKIKPSEIGLASIHDRDVIIYCISHAHAAMKDGKNISSTMRFIARDLLIRTQRIGKDCRNGKRIYDLLYNALVRLSGTRIETNIRNGPVEYLKNFGLLNEFQILRTTKTGRMLEIEVDLPKWTMDAINSNNVLTYHSDYFRLRSTIARAIYELMRKHCGTQEKWLVNTDTLHHKSGSGSLLKTFKNRLIDIVELNYVENYMPDYTMEIFNTDNPNPQLIVRPKPEFLEQQAKHIKNHVEKPVISIPKNMKLNYPLKPKTLEDAKKYAYHGDIYELVSEWKDWVRTIPNKINNPDGHFINFCKRKHDNYFKK